MRVLDLFSGIGGFSLGLERAGMETVAFCEIDPFCQKVLKKHWPDIPVHDDVRVLDGREYSPDLVCGGYPCQPFSTAGKRGGEKDDRHLWPSMFAIIKRCRPSWVVAENVAGHITMGLDSVLSDLESEGYACQAFIIPACAVDAKHRRDRVWVVANDAKRFDGTHNAQPDQRQKQKFRKGVGSNVVANTISERGCSRNAKWQNAENARQSPSNSGNNTGAMGMWHPEPGMGRGFDGFPIWLDGHCGNGLSYGESQRRVEVLRGMWCADAAEPLQRTVRGLGRIQKAEVLFSFVREYEKGSHEARLLLAGKEASEGFLRSLRASAGLTGAPHKSGYNEQSASKHSNALQALPRLLAHNSKESWEVDSWEDAVSRVAHGIPRRVDRLRSLGNAVVPQVVEMIGAAIMEAEQQAKAA